MAAEEQRAGRRSPRVLFLGAGGAFSLAALGQLLAAGVEVAAVATLDEAPGAPPATLLAPPASRSPLPLAAPQVRRSIIELAWERGIPAVALGSLGDPAALAALGAYGADLGCVACFPRRLPPALLALPPLGFLNAHPALLPAHRGPAPLFWALRAGELHTGVTAHWMDADLDTGPIALHRRVALPEGVGYGEAERLLAEAGGRLLADVIDLVEGGLAPSRPQGAGGSYEPWPGADDLIAEAAWPARRAFIFLCGVAEWGGPLLMRLPDGLVRVEQVIGYEGEGSLDTPYRRSGRELHVRCSPGVLRLIAEPHA